MCNLSQSVKNAIGVAISQNINNGNNFTAYNISKEVQTAIKPDFVRHVEMRDFIHSVMQGYVDNGGCTKQLEYIPVANAYAFMYRPFVDHVDKTISDGPVTMGLRDNRDRFCVPAEVLRNAGFKPRQSALLVKRNDGGLYVFPANSPFIIKSYMTCTIDKSNNLRLNCNRHGIVDCVAFIDDEERLVVK